MIPFGADVGPLEMLTISMNSTSLVALHYGSAEQAPFNKATQDLCKMAGYGTGLSGERRKPLNTPVEYKGES